MSSIHLENFLVSLETLPPELRRIYSLIKDLSKEEDDALADQMDERYIQGLLDLPANERSAKIAGLLAHCREAEQRAEQRVILAHQAVELVKEQRAKLAKDFVEMNMEGYDNGAADDFPDAAALMALIESAINNRQTIPAEPTELPAPNDSVQQAENEVLPAANSQAPEGSATYCYCKGPFHGNMIGCDGKKCKIEWFHFECVGLEKAPKGKWFCPDCRK
eukprot:Clim_evm60s210 gene=Clim_evmTU60s210